MQQHGGKCVFSSEWDKHAVMTYRANFGDSPWGDITLESTKAAIPADFDILCAGFPCQPFSIAGVSKKRSLGRETGFLDRAQGTLFFEVAEILRRHRPKAFLLENVKNLLSHDRGRTFEIIHSTLQQLGYRVHYQICTAVPYVPQHRERVMLVGFNTDTYGSSVRFTFPELLAQTPALGSILQEDVPDKYTLSDKLWGYLQRYAEKHRAKGNGFGYGLADVEGIARTLSARYYKDGSEILIPQAGRNPRRLTPRECARLMGYPDSYIINAVSDVQAYRQLGNSVVVPMVSDIARMMVDTMFGCDE
jgi:DNA (cytosine-5-)-methyltransferase